MSQPLPSEIALPGDAPVSHAARRGEVHEVARLTAENAALRAERDAARNGERKAKNLMDAWRNRAARAEKWLEAIAEDHDYLCQKCMGTGKDTSPFDRDDRLVHDPRDLSNDELGWCEPCAEPDCLNGHEMPVARPEVKS